MSRGYDAVVFDLLTALLDSWTLWDSVAGSRERGRAWRAAYLKQTYATGAYRPYETLVAEAAEHVGDPKEYAKSLIRRWDELAPWPDVPEVLRALSGKVSLGVVTNCSEALAKHAVARTNGKFDVVVSAERAGYYKPAERPYRLALEELGVSPERTLFVAGSAYDLIGASKLGMPTYWHNRAGMPAVDGTPNPLATYQELGPLLDIVFR